MQQLITKNVPFPELKQDHQVIAAVAFKKHLPEFPPSLLGFGESMRCIWNVLLLCWTHSVDARLEISELIRALEICIEIVSGAESEANKLSDQLPSLLTDDKEVRISHLIEYNNRTGLV